MKAQLLLLSAASLLLAGVSHAQAAGRDVEAYLDRAARKAAQTLAETGLPAPPSIRATVSGDGRLSGVHVARSSGSLEADRKAEQALRRLKVGDPPPELAGAVVTLPLEAPSTGQGGTH